MSIWNDLEKSTSGMPEFFKGGEYSKQILHACAIGRARDQEIEDLKNEQALTAEEKLSIQVIANLTQELDNMTQAYRWYNQTLGSIKGHLEICEELFKQTGKENKVAMRELFVRIHEPVPEYARPKVADPTFESNYKERV